jgi:hypothetical protein
MKHCNRCNLDKPLEHFSSKGKNKKQPYCKSCSREYTREHYRKNKKSYLDKNKRNKDKVKYLVFDYLLNHSCIDCDENNPILLDFDHRDPENKSFSIATAIGRGMKTWAKIKEEIDKCDIRCVRCHRLRTAKQFGWFRYVKCGGDVGIGSPT